ncbi:MAG: hypothetical protein R3B97_03445 [Dehalococcoidia bacterium]|nr:hypothetical protein [Dehalococcoidia bacterium]
MRNWRKTTAGVLAAAAMALVSLTGPALATGNTQISGVGRFDADETCSELPSLFTMTMVGDLVGCWYTTSFEVVQETASGIYQERGTETFVGCLADGTTCGTFSTTYKFTAKYATDGSEIHGRCQHPIVGGTGGFAAISGRVDFKDDVQTGDANYRGHLKLQ